MSALSLEPEPLTTPAEDLALDLEDLVERIVDVRVRHAGARGGAVTPAIDLKLGTAAGELLAIARELAPDLVSRESLDRPPGGGA